MAFSTIVGLAIAIACPAIFALLLPRKGRLSPLLRNDTVESVLIMGLMLAFSSGFAVALMGFPTGQLPAPGQ